MEKGGRLTAATINLANGLQRKGDGEGGRLTAATINLANGLFTCLSPSAGSTLLRLSRPSHAAYTVATSSHEYRDARSARQALRDPQTYSTRLGLAG